MLLDLLGARRRPASDELDPARSLEVGEFREAMVEHLLSGRRSFGDGVVQDDAGEHFFFADVVGDRKHGHLLHQMMSLQYGLDLGRGDVLAGSADDVLLSVDEMESSIGLLTNRVPGMKPAAPPCMCGRLFVGKIVRKEVAARRRFRMPYDHFAGQAGCDVPVLIIQTLT